MPALDLPESEIIDMHFNEEGIEPEIIDMHMNDDEVIEDEVIDMHMNGDDEVIEDSQPEFRWNPVRDQEGRVHLFDANPVEMEPEPSFNAMNDVVFILFTRRNPTAGQIINFNMNTVRNSNFAAAQPVRFIIHGWQSDRNTAMNRFMRDDFLALANHNVIGMIFSIN